MRSKILAGTIIFGLLAVIALGIVAASPNSQATTPTPTATPTPSEEAYNLLIAAIGEALPPAKDILYVRLTDLLIEKVIAPNSTQTPTQIKTGILAGLDNPTVTETLIATLKVADPQGVLANSLANFFIDFIADSTGETAAEVRARLSTPATPTPTPTPTGSATATPSPTPTPTGSPTATPSPTPTPVPPTAYLDVWDVSNWDGTIANTTRNIVITWDETTLVRRAPTASRTPTTVENGEKARIDKITATDPTPTPQEKLHGYLTRAEISFDTGNYSGAISDLTNAINLTGEDPLTPADNVLLNLRGIAYAFAKDYTKAEADFTNALRTADNELRVAANNNRGAVKALRGRYADALTDYQSAITLDTSSYGKEFALNNRASTLIQRDRTDSGRDCDSPLDTTDTDSDLDCAIKDYGSAIEGLANDNVLEARFLNNRGLAHAARDKTDSGRDCDDNDQNTDSDLDCAIKDFTSAKDNTDSNLTDPEKARFLNNRGLAYMARDNPDSLPGTAPADSDLDEAITDFTDAITRAENGPVADKIAFLNNRGLAHLQRSDASTDATDKCNHHTSATTDLDCAITDYSTAIGTHGATNDSNTYYNRGLAYFKRNAPGDMTLAIADFTDAIRLDNKNANSYYSRGLTYRERNNSGDRVRGISDFTDAIRLGKRDAITYTNRGELYQQENDHPKAIADFTEAIKLTPSKRNLYTSRATSYSSNGDPSNASEDHAFATKIAAGTVACSDFRDFDARHDTTFGSDRRAAKAFVADLADDDDRFDTALGTGDNVCATLSDTPSRSATPTPTPP